MDVAEFRFILDANTPQKAGAIDLEDSDVECMNPRTGMKAGAQVDSAGELFPPSASSAEECSEYELPPKQARKLKKTTKEPEKTTGQERQRGT